MEPVDGRDDDRASRIHGCLLGGAVGDALGAPVEFLSLKKIRAHFGPEGIRELASAYGGVGTVTDDTQMTLFTSEGLIRAQVRYEARGICDVPSVIHHALLRWLYTQGERSPALRVPPDGWLVAQKELFARRSPGMTCLSSLAEARRLGENAVNGSKGCGAIMRIAPIGLFVTLDEEPGQGVPRAYELACESARSTHAHPSSTAASGVFAVVVARLKKGEPLRKAILSSRSLLKDDESASEVSAAMDHALKLASSKARSTPEVVESLGQGWVAEEALAIALFCSLRAESFEQGVRLAVNHGGDSDSTGSLTGQLLGTLWGERAIPRRWIERLELRDIITHLARDMVTVLEGGRLTDDRDYPGW